jgi:iron(III) transport system substrate-binding protein
MKKKKIFSAAAVAVAAAMAGPAQAQDWTKEKAELIAAAEKEGALSFYSQPNLAAREYISKAWAAAFPKITMTLQPMPIPQFMARFRTERQTGNYLWDVALSGYTVGYILAKEGGVDEVLPEILDPDIKRPELWGGWDKAFVDLQGKYVLSVSQFVKGVYYNALHVAPDEVKAKGLQLLFDPKYKGKAVWHDPSTPGSGDLYPFFIQRRFGDEGLKRLVVDQRVTWVAQQQEVVEQMVRGTAFFGMGPAVTGLLGQYEKAGVKLDIRAMGNTPELNDMSIGGSTLYVFNKRPHPNAARLFVNWVLSKDVQYELAKAMIQNSRRKDVPSVTLPGETAVPGATYLENQREEYDAAAQKARALAAEFRKEVP